MAEVPLDEFLEAMAAIHSPPRILPSGDAAITVEFSRTIDAEANRRVLALDRTLASEAIAGITETVPTVSRLTANPAGPPMVRPCWRIHHSSGKCQRNRLYETSPSANSGRQVRRRTCGLRGPAKTTHASRSAGSQAGAPSTLAGRRPGRDGHAGREDDRRQDMRRKEMGDMGTDASHRTRLSQSWTPPVNSSLRAVQFRHRFRPRVSRARCRGCR